ncbi:hypothetical protein ABT116_30850 [Streptomyces sp. NPDC002130]|uniref:hypothetical protein n=1 Tax=Streptomyces sp. NPDC002130 TaxID=3155568 RepID=UPI00331D3372
MATRAVVRSDRCGLDQLIAPYSVADAVRERLVQGDGRPRRWSSTWRFSSGDVVWPVRDLASVPVLGSEPVRRFTWRARQRHRPGLQFMVSTGRLHGFESLEEQRLQLVYILMRATAAMGTP